MGAHVLRAPHCQRCALTIRCPIQCSLRAASQNASSNVSNVRPTSNVRRFACFDFEDAAPVLRERLETRGTGDRDIELYLVSHVISCIKINKKSFLNATALYNSLLALHLE